MVVGLFIGMAVIVVILFTVTYVEIVRIWRDIDSMRREMRRIRKELDCGSERRRTRGGV